VKIIEEQRIQRVSSIASEYDSHCTVQYRYQFVTCPTLVWQGTKLALSLSALSGYRHLGDDAPIDVKYCILVHIGGAQVL